MIFVKYTKGKQHANYLSSILLRSLQNHKGILANSVILFCVLPYFIHFADTFFLQ
jgi:hypothetical protein